MFKLLAFLAIIQLAQSTCVKGPSYWCQSVKTANECKAFKHCVQTVWSKQASYTDKKLTIFKNQNCQECVTCLHGDLRRCPNINPLKDEITFLFENNVKSEAICRLIDQCSATSSNTVTSDLTRCNSENTCASLDMAVKCSSIQQCMKEWKIMPKTQIKQSNAEMTQKQLNDENTCGFCIFILTKYQNIISENSTEVDALNYLDSACRLLPSSELAQQCQSQVAIYVPQIINLLRDNADPGVVCHVLQLCKDQHLQLQNFEVPQIRIKVVDPKKAKIVTPLQKTKNQKAIQLAEKMTLTEGMGCEMCTIIFNAAKYLVKNDVDNKKVLMFIEKNLCNRLGEYNATCTEYLQTEGEIIIQFLEDEIEPAFICHEMGLCMNTQMSVAKMNPFDLKNQSPTACHQCKKTIDHIKTMVAERDHKNVEILDYVKENMCQTSGDMKYLCSSLFDAYSETILAMFEQDIKSEQICEIFETCATKSPVEELFYNIDKPKSSQSVESDPNNCVVCQFVMKLLDQELSKNETEAQIKSTLDKICNIMFPSAYKKQCVNFVETYTDTVIFLIVKQIPAEYICEVIGVCKQSTYIQEFLENNDLSIPKNILIGADEKNINNLAVADPPSSECVMCEFAINILSNMVKKDSTKAELIAAMKNVCNKELPDQLKDQCNQFVNMYGEQIIQMLLQKMDPKVICQDINICPKPATKVNLLGSDKIYKKLTKEILQKDSIEMIELKPAKQIKTVSSTLKVFEEKKNDDTIGCSLCIYAAQLTDNFLKQNKTEEEIQEELKLVCNYFPAKLEAECSAFIAEYGPYVIQLIVADLDPKEVCTELDLCGDNEKKTSFDFINKLNPSKRNKRKSNF